MHCLSYATGEAFAELLDQKGCAYPVLAREVSRHAYRARTQLALTNDMVVSTMMCDASLSSTGDPCAPSELALIVDALGSRIVGSLSRSSSGTSVGVCNGGTTVHVCGRAVARCVCTSLAGRVSCASLGSPRAS
eukprot:4723750-Prymnesium_polylepis.2